MLGITSLKTNYALNCCLDQNAKQFRTLMCQIYNSAKNKMNKSLPVHL